MPTSPTSRLTRCRSRKSINSMKPCDADPPIQNQPNTITEDREMADSLRHIQFIAWAVCCLCACTKISTAPQRDTEVQSPSNREQYGAEQPEVPKVRKPIAKVLGREIFEDDLAQPASVDKQSASSTDAELGEYRR